MRVGNYEKQEREQNKIAVKFSRGKKETFFKTTNPWQNNSHSCRLSHNFVLSANSRGSVSALLRSTGWAQRGFKQVCGLCAAVVGGEWECAPLARCSWWLRVLRHPSTVALAVAVVFEPGLGPHLFSAFSACSVCNLVGANCFAVLLFSFLIRP